MGQLTADTVPEVRVTWGSHNVWKAGQQHDGPVHAHTIWLLLYGHAQVSDGAQLWDVQSGHILLWPCDKHRHIVALSDSAWLSVGIAATAPAQTDILRLLPLPAVHFQQNMGQSPRDYLQHQRLELARKLLETTALPVSTIATQTGFISVPHFT